MRISGRDEPHGLHGGANHPRRQVHGGGGDAREEAHDGLDAARVTRVPQSLQSQDHVGLGAVSQTLQGHVQQRLEEEEGGDTQSDICPFKSLVKYE